MLHSFHHYNGIIYHNTNGQYKAKHGKGIDGKTKRYKENKGANDRHWDGQYRDKCCAPALQKEEYHHRYQSQCFKQGV